jgi:hypothetical protein
MDQEICQIEGWNEVGGKWGENNSGKKHVCPEGWSIECPHQVKIGGGGLEEGENV